MRRRLDAELVRRGLAETRSQARGHIEAGRVLLPERAPWLADYVDEMSAFPNGEHDDQVDSSSQALNWLALQPKRELFIGRAG